MKTIFLFLIIVSVCSCSTTQHYYSFQNQTKVFNSPTAETSIGELNQQDTLIFDTNKLYGDYVPIGTNKFSQTGYVYRYNLVYTGFRKSKKRYFPKYRSYFAKRDRSLQNNSIWKGSSSSTVYTGPRGGRYEYNSKGNKVYLSSKKKTGNYTSRKSYSSTRTKSYSSKTTKSYSSGKSKSYSTGKSRSYSPSRKR